MKIISMKREDVVIAIETLNEKLCKECHFKGEYRIRATKGASHKYLHCAHPTGCEEI